MFPLIPLLALGAMIGGGVTLAWYFELDPKQQEEADRIACDYAWANFKKSLKELTKAERDHVASLTQQHFAG